MIDTTTNNGSYTGDPAKTAFTKTNDNFTECYANISAAQTAAAAAQTAAAAALPKAGCTVSGNLNVTGSLGTGQLINVGQNLAGAAGVTIRFLPLADKTIPTVQMVATGGSATNNGTISTYCGANVTYGTTASYGTQVRAGLSGAWDTNYYNFNWTGTTLQAWIGDANVGIVSLTGSDKRIKQDVVYIDATSGGYGEDLEKILALRPVEFKYEDGSVWDDKKRHRSFIADDVYAIDPMLTDGEPGQTNADGSVMPMGLNPNAFFSRLVGAIHAQDALIQALTARIEKLEALQGASTSADSGS